ncbi:uncharacterized protein LOC110687706 [Chenopodium quinoa]|uniref:uncharacterized protein LOC110687706 n=1 Tax=Chenopodium quinoa TaxID=63459 RepID=UPI000B783C02|nr:uncharacterized protein LOC110687706 [Chenopodium quinoa]
MDNELLHKCILFLLLYELLRLLTLIHHLPLRIGGESGSAYITRLLTVHPGLFKEQLRLDRDMFVQLVQLMIEKNLLSDGRFVKVVEQVGIGLFILARGASQRQDADTFKHSISTISKYFRRVLQALTRLSCDLIRPYQDLANTPPEVQENSLYWPFLKDCVGALDGTHISAVVSDGDGHPFRGCKGTKTWNVLASCSFNRLFTFVNVGYQGSARDITVWRNCLTDPKFEFPHPPLGIPISERCANVEPRVEYSIFDEGRKAQMDIVQNQIAEHIWQSVRDIEEEDHHMDVE